LRLKWTAPVLVVASARDEELAEDAPPLRWIAAGRAREIRLRELPVEVLAEALSEGGLPMAAARRIAAHTEGNPLFATELALLVRDGRPLDAALPGSVRDVMEARIERLGTVGKEVAKRAALVGRRFTRQAVERIWDDTPAELDAGLRALLAAEAIAEEPSPIDQNELVFRHQRLADAALARVPPAERQSWLDRLGAWAESELERHPAQPFLIELAARACEARGDSGGASAWHERLGALHERNHRPREAAASFAAALAGATALRQRVILRHLCEALRQSGEPARALEMLDRAKPEPGAEGELAAADRMLELVRAETLSELARTPEARAAFEALRPRLGSDLERLRFARGMVFLLSELVGDPKEAQRICAELRAQVDMNDPSLGAERLALLAAEGNVEWRLGRYDRAAANTDERLALAQEQGDRQAECIAWNLKGTVQGARCDLTGAVVGYERSLAVAQAIGHRLREAIALHNLGLVHADQGEWDQARTRQEQYLALSAMIGNHLSEAHGPRALATIAVATRQYADGEAQVDRALAAADKNGWPLLTAWARAVRGQLALRRYLDERDAGELERATVELGASETQWAFCDDAGEYFAFLAAAHTLAGQPESARQALERARAAIDPSWTLGRAWIDVAAFMIERKPPGTALDWFRERAHIRAVTLLAPLARVLQ
jgi:tetratricopeptide (TPR) repeat protein